MEKREIMEILVLNGSPKGNYSVTLQTVLFLQKLNPAHNFTIVNVGQSIRKIEKDPSPVINQMEKADLILFSYPVYTFLAPYQLHRFVELVKESKVDLTGKFVTQITTSKHFYDITAHAYIEDNCFDMGMKVIHGLSADMEDLPTKTGQKQATDFFNYVCHCAENNIYINKQTVTSSYTPVVASKATCCPDKKGNVVVLTNKAEDDVSLQAMIDRFCAVLPYQTRVINIAEYPFKGGCLGCFNCAVTGKCVYKDRFDQFLRNEIQTADAMVYAFSIKDHSMGASFKLYTDRQFCNGHRTVTMGMPVGYLVSGNYSAETNLQTTINARAQVGGNFLAGVATDEFDTDKQIDNLANTLSYALQNKYVPPSNFYGVGGMKIFRDLIWMMQGMMRADHKFYKKHGQYDFPQKQWPKMLAMYSIGAILSSDKIKSKMGNKMNEGMLMPYKKVLDQLDKHK